MNAIRNWKNSAGAVGAMRQQAMKASGNCKHAHDVERQTGNHRNPAHAGPDDQQTCEMHEKKLRADEIIEFFVIKRCDLKLIDSDN